jgi:hypothetical protein
MKTTSSKLPHSGVYARLGISGIHGVGVFAITRIPKGTYIFPDDDEEIIGFAVRTRSIDSRAPGAL